MGREIIEVKVVASLSKHNSDQDDKDEAAWEEFRRVLELLCADPDFADIRPLIV